MSRRNGSRCMQTGESWYACRTSLQGFVSCGGWRITVRRWHSFNHFVNQRTAIQPTLNLRSPIGGSAYGTPMKARIPLPLSLVRYRPTSGLPFGSLTCNSLEVLADISSEIVKITKQVKNLKSNIFTSTRRHTCWVHERLLTTDDQVSDEISD